MKIYSWNVNGIRAVWGKELFQKFIEEHQPDILCLQETKIDVGQLTKNREVDQAAQIVDSSRQGIAVATSRSENRNMPASASSNSESLTKINLPAEQGQSPVELPNYEEYWNSATKKGYSGTAIFTKTKPISVINDIPKQIADKYELEDKYGHPNEEGRVLAAEFEDFYVVTVYTPNSKGDLSRLKLRHQAWDKAFLEYMKQLEARKPVIFCGDFNVAHTEDDLANPQPNVGKHGFTNEEREGFDHMIAAGFVDTFRIFTKGNGHYSWWTHWANARARNVGWRIDYFMVSGQLKPRITSAAIHSDVMGSDHCPVSIEIAPS